MKLLKNQKWFNYFKFSIMLFAFFCIMLVFQGFASWIGTVVAGLFTYRNVDPYNIFASAFVHHVIQMLIPLMLLALIKFKYKIDLGFNIRNAKTGIRHIFILSVFMIIHAILFYYILYSTTPYEGYNYPLTTLNVIGKLGFEYAITGPSEEILFRVFPISLFIILFKKSFPIKWGLTLEVLIAAVLFTLAHGNYILSLDYYFIGYTFVLGLLYGFTYQKTGSIVYPMIMHSMTNIIMVGTSFLFHALH